ncbi:MAG: hypothetical protein AMS17_10910 [Spirochaetes bacterium DG_61]|nr:MAG: hypothetical protein AMS17_10910 [Spirochaetes bacterium DG_61]
MKTSHKKQIIVCMSVSFLLFTKMLFGENTLNKDIQKIIDETVFEVVVSKPDTDSLTYEKPLPLDLIPYAIRMDKYYSIGTAFAVSERELLSAAHLFNLDSKTQYQDIYVRDKQGNVYEVDEIHKYEDHKDFVLFTVKGKKFNRTLAISNNIELNDSVFAVGNAFGEGIIIRNGVLTSKTLEEEKGEWEWIRFSAPVSPGNSGGPLLDRRGNAIGLITRKSENENLNFALPFSVINESKEQIAVSHKKIRYLLENTYKSKMATYDYITNLPKNYYDLKEELTSNFTAFITDTLDTLLKENSDTFFPEGKGSLNLLHNTLPAYFPHLICEEDDGSWWAYYPSETKEAELDNNGYIEWGDMNGLTFIYLKKPDNISLKELCENSKLFMDLILKGFFLYRDVMNENIRITSLGEAYEQYDYTDNFKRKWLVRTWLLEYSDVKLVTFSLLIPGGSVTILVFDQIDRIDNGYLLDLKVLSNFIYLSYYGTFKQWNEFFVNSNYLPDIFSTFDFSYIPDKSASFASKRISISYDDDIFEISEESDLSLEFTFFQENNEVVWDIGGIIFGEDKDNYNYFSIYKNLRPEEGLNDSYFSDWEKLSKQEYPFNNRSYLDDGQTHILNIHPKYQNEKTGRSYIYSVGLTMEGKVSNSKMKKKMKGINASIAIHE